MKESCGFGRTALFYFDSAFHIYKWAALFYIFDVASYIRLNSQKTKAMLKFLVPLAVIAVGVALYFLLRGDGEDEKPVPGPGGGGGGGSVTPPESPVETGPGDIEDRNIDLKKVKGIGPARSQKLVDHFGSKLEAAKASSEEIEEVIGSDDASKRLEESSLEDLI